MRVPYIFADPAKVLGQFYRRAVKHLGAVGRFIARLGQVCMAVDTVCARQGDALAHQVWRDRERRARSQHDPEHAIAARVVVLFDEPLRIAQDGGLVLDDAIWRQAALRLANRHRATCGMEAETHLTRRLDLVVQARAVGPEVGVVAGCRAAGEHQLGNRDLRADRDRLGGHPRPDGVMYAQPGK